MKKFNKIGLHLLFWITIPLVIFYFKWAAQDTSALPGLPATASDSFFEIVRNNMDVTFVSIIGSIPVFYWSLYFLTPKLLFKRSYLKIALYAALLTGYFLGVVFISGLVLPMYFYFGTPYAIKVLAPIILLSALGGTLASKRNVYQ